MAGIGRYLFKLIIVGGCIFVLNCFMFQIDAVPTPTLYVRMMKYLEYCGLGFFSICCWYYLWDETLLVLGIKKRGRRR